MGFIDSFWQNRSLIKQMVTREVYGRYKGSVLGLLWSFFLPLIMLAVYTFVFGVVFKARWSVGLDSKINFALTLFIGLMIHTLFAECVNRAPVLILGNANYVKKVVFPLEVLPWVAMGAALFHFLVSLVVWGVAYFVAIQSFHWTIIYLPLVIFPLVLFTMGITWFLASLGVYLRDVGQLTGVVTTLMLFLSPIFYPMSALPEKYHIFVYANPLTLVIEQARGVLLFGDAPEFGIWLMALSIATLVAWLGYTWFEKTRAGFADVL